MSKDHHVEDHEHDHDHDRGLSHDLPKIVERSGIGRRGLLALFGGVGAVAIAGCGSEDSTSSSSRSAGTAAQAPSGGGDTNVSVSEGEIPEETAGPYPGDGSNGPDVLSESGVVRRDITSSFGTASGTGEGVPMTIRMKVYDLNGDDATILTGAAVYAWHCDREGRYSMYDSEIADENYLRGVQEADDKGWVEFTSIFPAAYDGRWPHVHFEVYKSLDDATNATNKLRTSQLALPKEACDAVYATDGYEDSVANLARTSLDSDMVFGDGYSLQLAKLTGSIKEGYVATLNVPV
jgi:protocatechuate 3,4-dioxygenase beta subunit